MPPEQGPGPEFLKQKYDLHNSPEVAKSAELTEHRTGEKLPDDAESKIQSYLDRLGNIINPPKLEGHENFDRKERNLEMLKTILHDNFVIKAENVPESAFLLEQRIAREQGHGNIEITDEYKKLKTDQIINNQNQSIDQWIEYLTSSDADYPDWAKYWAFRSVFGMGKLQKETDDQGKESARFNKRDVNTVASFPPLNPRALAMTIGVLRSYLEQNKKPKKDRLPVENKSVKLDDEEFQKLLSTENFSKIYAQFLIEMPEYSTQGLRETRGRWVKYDKDSDPKPLVDSLDGYPLEWCTANIDTARTQLQGGDFYVYYSINETGEAVIPRLAIRMQAGKIAENPRGIAPNQNLDPYIGDVLEEKLNSGEFPDKDEFQKKSEDMKRLTAIEEKTKRNKELSPEDLRFLYEIDSKIQGFGYEADPRIKEIRDERNPKEDAPIVFECQPQEIAWSAEQVDQNTKGYIGPLFPGIFTALGHLEHLYTAFPEGKITRGEVEIGGKNAAELEQELKDKNISIGSYALDMLHSPDFTTIQNKEQLQTIRSKVRDLGFESDATTDQIYARAAELGLELCPAEVGPYERLQNKDQPLGERYAIAMEQITGRNGLPYVFTVRRSGRGLWLDDSWTYPTDLWHLDRELLFRLRNVSQES